MKIVGMLAVYNDNDIIEEIIQHLISQGIDLVVLDNGSTDGTYEICKKFVGKGILDLFQYKTSRSSDKVADLTAKLPTASLETNKLRGEIDWHNKHIKYLKKLRKKILNTRVFEVLKKGAE